MYASKLPSYCEMMATTKGPVEVGLAGSRLGVEASRKALRA